LALKDEGNVIFKGATTDDGYSKAREKYTEAARLLSTWAAEFKGELMN